MRTRVAVLLIALLAIVAVPSEATLVEQSGSVVDQVVSCLQPNGLVRELDGSVTAASECDGAGTQRLPMVLLPIVGLLLAGLVLGSRSRVGRRSIQRWHLPETFSWSGAPLRAPPRAV